ncbi:MAG: polysaccharide deacetylase family protein [Desulfobacterales bacterium]|nr:MAG: polysaccharide deacetylase family protein [Desulfobacterales bacterium]
MANGRKKYPSPVLIALIGVLWVNACLPAARQQMPNNDLYNATVVTIKEGDTLPDLAKKYLSDPSNSYIIADFNKETVPSPGQKIIIPLIPLGRGGLQTEGYQTVPVLRYKKFSKDQTDPTAVTRRAFEDQLVFLKKQGYHVITLDQLLDFLEFKDQIPRKSVAITIDDSWNSFLETAYPLLKNYRMPATLFVQTDLVGKKDALSWPEIRYLSREGIDIQCRSKTHQNFKSLRIKKNFNQYVTALDKELSRSQADIKRALGKNCRYLAYPDGPINTLLVAFAQKHDFRAGFMPTGTSNPFYVDNYRIGRTLVSADDDLEKYQQKLAVFETMSLK